MSAQRPLRVLQVVQRFYPELGGLETHVAEVTRRLAQVDDVDVTVLTTDRSGRLPREDRVNGVRVLRRRSWPREGELYFSPGLARVIRQGGWDIIHVQGSQTTVPTVAMLAARSARIPYVVTFHSGGHSSAAHAPITRVQNALNRPLLRGAAALIAVSRFERRRFQRITGLPEDRFVVIPNGGALPPVPTGTIPERGRIITSGRLERYKGHHRVIAALPLVQQRIPEARLTVLGSGPFEPELRRLAMERGVADHVEFRHLLPAQRREMAEVLSAASVMAALSDYEAHPVAVMEAVALGLPVLGSDVAGIGDLVEDGLVTGVAPDASDTVVADMLVASLTSSTGRPHEAPDFELPTWEQSADRIADIYRTVARGASTSTPALRVAQVITTLTTGGAERQVESIVRHSRHTHRVIALYGGGPVADALRSEHRLVDVLHLQGPARLLALPALALRLRRLRPDVVQVHLLTGQLWGLTAARLAGVPAISTEHSLMDESIENRPLTPSLRVLYLALNLLAQRTVAVSAATAARLVRWGVPERRITVIDNGIEFDRLAYDPEARRRIRDELALPDAAPVIGAVGRLEAVKRFPQLLDAVAPLLDGASGEATPHLVIVGGGPLEASLRRRSNELGIADRVHILGSRPDVGAVLSAIDVLVSPSRDETFGMAVVEGMAAGLPVVVAQAPALDVLPARSRGVFWLPAGTGREHEAIRSATSEALALALAAGRLSVPPALRLAYDIGATTARLDSLLEQVARRGGRRR